MKRSTSVESAARFRELRTRRLRSAAAASARRSLYRRREHWPLLGDQHAADSTDEPQQRDARRLPRILW